MAQDEKVENILEICNYTFLELANDILYIEIENVAQFDLTHDIVELIDNKHIKNIMMCYFMGHYHGPDRVYYARDYVLSNEYIARLGDDEPCLYELVENTADSILDVMIDEKNLIRKHPRIVEDAVLDLIERGIIEPGKIAGRFWLIFKNGEFECIVLDEYFEIFAYRGGKESETYYYHVTGGEFSGRFVAMYYSRSRLAPDYEASFISRTHMIDLIDRDDDIITINDMCLCQHLSHTS